MEPKGEARRWDKLHMNSTMQEPIVLTVSQITSAIKQQLETTFSLVWVRGEVSNCKKQSSGHTYFSLVDKEAQITCVLFKGVSSRYPIPLKDGDDVLISGELSVYPPRGGYQLIIRSIQLTGAGEKLLQLQALKQKLQALGWTRAERKRSLPKEISTITLVTSPTGAVLRDILTILRRRMIAFRLIVNPVKVQGEGAAEEIEKAIDEVSRHQLGDVLILCRGGGSAEDLSPFNEERVARAIVMCSLPVISAVGHETDVTIADLVADVRAPTPSAAAELVSLEKEELFHTFERLTKSLQLRMLSYLQGLRIKIQKLAASRSLSRMPYVIANRLQQMDDLSEASQGRIKNQLKFKSQQLLKLHRLLIATSPLMMLSTTRKEHLVLEQKLQKSLFSLFERKKRTLELFTQQLLLLNPARILKRGYAIVTSSTTGRVISSVSEAKLANTIRVQFQDGTIDATVLPKTHSQEK